MQLGKDSKKTRAPSSSAVERRRCTDSRTSPYRSAAMPAHPPSHDRPEAGVDRRLAAGDDRAPEAGAMEEGGTPEERLGRMEEERRVSRVATHRTVVVALLAEPKEDGALRRDGLVVGDLLLEEPRCGCSRKVLARRSHNELRSAG